MLSEQQKLCSFRNGKNLWIPSIIKLYGLEGLRQGDDKQYHHDHHPLHESMGVFSLFILKAPKTSKNYLIHILASPKWRHRRSDIAGKSMETGNLKLMVRSFSIIIIFPIMIAYVWIQYFLNIHSIHVNLGTVLQMHIPKTWNLHDLVCIWPP